MTSERLVSGAKALAVAGWLALLLAPRRGQATWLLAGRGLPALLAAGSVVRLAGWVHSLASALFIGAWICRRAAAEGISPWLVRLCVPPTSRAAPARLLLFLHLPTALRHQEIRA